MGGIGFLFLVVVFFCGDGRECERVEVGGLVVGAVFYVFIFGYCYGI